MKLYSPERTNNINLSSIIISMGSSLLESLQFGKHAHASEENSGLQPVLMRDFLIALRNRDRFENGGTDADQLLIHHTTWENFVTDFALHRDLRLDLQPFGKLFGIGPLDMDMVEFGHHNVLGLVGAVGTEHTFDDASVVVALDVLPVGYDLAERHRGESGVIRPIALHMCGLATGAGTQSTPHILSITYELAALRPQTLAHQIGSVCEAREFAVSRFPHTSKSLREMGLHKGVLQHRENRTDSLPYSTTADVDSDPFITARMKKIAAGQTQLCTGTITNEGLSFIPVLPGSNQIQVFPANASTDYQIRVEMGPYDDIFFPAFLGRSE